MLKSKSVPLQLMLVFTPDPSLFKQLCSASANALTASDAYADTLYRSPSWICIGPYELSLKANHVML